MPAHHPHREHAEEDSLLPRPRSEGGTSMSSRGFTWGAHPFWLIPVVLVMSMSRGVTMSPRIQVYRAIACQSLSKDSFNTDLIAFMENCDDANVQARAAKIQASVVTTMSVLSAISTGFWSRLGDTHGRKLVLVVFLSGALLMEGVFLLVMRPQSLFGRYAEQFILVGPVLEGFVGGLSTFNGVVHAYISDCTRHGSRSTIFSTVQGMVFVGLAIGPWLDGLFFPPTGYNSGYFIGSISLISLTILYVILICPESRQPTRPIQSSRTETDPSLKHPLLVTIKHLFLDFVSALLLPISMFKPRSIPGSHRKNYNMTLCGLGLFLYLVSIGIYSAKYLYAQHVFKWTTAQLGYYMSTLWITRALNLLVFLPIILSYLKPKPSSDTSGDPSARDVAAELKFDRYLVQISLAVDGFSDSLVALTSSRSQPVYYALSCLSSLTSGGNPALHSLGAVCLHACGHSSEVGALFGALGVLSAIAHIISPYIYALTYGSTVARFPEAIFVLAAGLLFSVVFAFNWISSAEEDIALVSTPRIGEDQRSCSLAREYTYHSVVETDEGDGEEALDTSRMFGRV